MLLYKNMTKILYNQVNKLNLIAVYSAEPAEPILSLKHNYFPNLKSCNISRCMDAF